MAIIFESLLLDVGVLAVCILTAVYFYFKRSWTYWKKQDVPYVEPTFPFGNFRDVMLLRKSLGEVYKNLYDQLDGKKYGGTYMFTKAGFLFRDPDIIKNVLVKDFSNFHDRGFYMNEVREPLSAHLFFLYGSKWRNLRVKLTPTFTSGKMKMMFQTLIECGQELGECLMETANNEKVIEIKDVVARFSTDVISSCAFGIQCNCLKNPDAEFRQWGRKIFRRSIQGALAVLLSLINPTLVETFKLKRLDTEVANYFRNMVEDTVNYREKNNVKRNDFMQLLIQLKNKGSVDADSKNGHQNEHTVTEEKSDHNALSMDSLAAQSFVFFLAGFETSSTTMTFCLYELSIHPNIQDGVGQEIDEIMKKYDGEITYEAVQEMEYLDKVVSGMRFGLMQTKVGLISLLSRYQFSVSKATPMPLVMEPKSIILSPVGGMHLQIKKRVK
ncbi:probable cytochrome P450 6a14 isoform X2 [Periplaneta americana]|uniref:probable cytochrome P450 6a14 isoform X2 n=1 Tax=Periplaneta americana TaxID=6978 RepID=UPI0037E957CF